MMSHFLHFYRDTLSTMALGLNHNDLGKQFHILIVDDSVDELKFLLETLRIKNYRVSVAFDGQQGYQRAQANSPDLVLMDVKMPKVDGYAACRLIKADRNLRHIPVLFLSCESTVENRLHGFNAGAVDYICKPFSTDEVLARVGIHLQLSQRNHSDLSAEDRLLTSDDAIVRATIQYLNNLRYPLPTLAEIAEKVGTYEKKLTQLFKQETGMTLLGFWREQKLIHAKKLLSSTQIPIIQIAEQAGYQNACNFATAFKDRFSVTPSAFRKSNKEAS
jgi:DNA-binding response OmpR family regulator